MSSGNEPYKSRLLNFLNRQTIHFQDKVGIALRNLRSTTEMGTQILLYPFYLMVQSGRATRQQLESRVQSSLFLSEAKTSQSKSSQTKASVPLDEILNLVEPWLEAQEINDNIKAETVDVLPVHENKANNLVDPWFNLPVLKKKEPQQSVKSSQLENIQTRFSPLSSQPSREIQGIASLLDSHKVVLVDRHNRILNVLNSRQQEILQQYFAKRHKKPNRFVTATQKVLASLPQISTRNSVKSSPVKVVWQMLDWLQASPVAKKVNLFGESKLVPSASVLPPNTNISAPLNLLVSLSNKIADLDTKSWLSNSRVGKYLSDRSSSTNIQTNSTQSSPELTSNPFQILAIIQAALEHFFGTNNSKINKQIKGGSQFNLPNSNQHIPLESKTASTYLAGKSPELNLPPAEEQESWLSWDDIFSNTITSTVKLQTSEHKTTNIQIKESHPLPLDKADDFDSLTYFDTHDTQLETDPNLLETKATTVGYEKHILEKILEILDQIFVWIEEKLLKIWRLFKFKSLH